MAPLTMHPNRMDASDLAEMLDFLEVAMRLHGFFNTLK